MKKIVYSLTYNKTIKLHLQVIVKRISVTRKALLQKILFEVLLMLDLTCSVLVTFLIVCSLQMG